MQSNLIQIIEVSEFEQPEKKYYLKADSQELYAASNEQAIDHLVTILSQTPVFRLGSPYQLDLQLLPDPTGKNKTFVSVVNRIVSHHNNLLYFMI